MTRMRCTWEGPGCASPILLVLILVNVAAGELQQPSLIADIIQRNTLQLDIGRRATPMNSWRHVKPVSEKHPTIRKELANGVGTIHAIISHRDAPSSPFRLSNRTRAERIHETILRDNLRVASIHARINQMVNGVSTSNSHDRQTKVPSQDFQAPVISGLSLGSGEYFIRVSVGTPPRGGGQVVLNKIPLGCGHDNEGYFVGAAGLLGLAVPPAGVRFTPQASNLRVSTFYYLKMTGISVGGSILTIPTSAFQLDSLGNGGVIIDSGTSVTRLQNAAYASLREAFRAGTSDLVLTTEFSLFDTCYNLSDLSSVDVPTVTLHFQGGADLKLPASNYLVPVDNSSTFCLAFAGTTGPSIIGNIQQQGFRVIYDNLHNQVGFVPSQCD
ncbi:aspartyl protease family protein 2 isoform X4 [Physcomitrium patens]|uniref:aspartyl protease family protein 2 isoform X4 n=1 Tax=Physcomitrium patens TaxID=3218 RepID=UPI003CCD8F47